MNTKLCVDCFMVESAEKFIYLLSKPITTHRILDRKNEHNIDLYSKWLQYFTELYNDRYNFLIMSYATCNRMKSNGYVLHKSFEKNYELMNYNFSIICANNLVGRKNEDNKKISLASNSWFNENKRRFSLYVRNEEENKSIVEYTIFTLVLFIIQYLHIFEEKSINTNLWNYCLRSSTFSYKNLLLGIFTLVCQYVWTGALIYSVTSDFTLNSDPIIIAITVMSTLLSILYSYDTILSFIATIPLYMFLIGLYEDYPELELNKEEQQFIYYKERSLSMNKWHIYYNFIADLFSNCILPLIIPIINIFIILNSEDIVDAILNCMAIFFILKIDEELYTVTQYESDQYAMNFTRWIISAIYCKYFPEFEDIFKLECHNWHSNILQVAKKAKNKRAALNKINPNNEIIINLNTGNESVIDNLD